jgi:hypothetical protein
LNIPEALAPLFDEGIIDRVVRPLMSGKEAQVFLVESGGELRVAKVYKNADHRSFKKRGDYTQGRKTRNSRDQRAVEKRSKHGRAEEEAAWKSAEVDIIHRLHLGGVRVPIPYAFVEGVLVMECVVDPEGNPAPRLGDLAFDPEGAKAMYDRVLQEVVRMLAVSRFSKTLATLLKSGVPLLKAMDIVKNVLDNAKLSKVVEEAIGSIREGESIAGPLRKSGQFPPIVTHMIAVGEKSGQLEQMLENVAKAYDSQVETRIQAMTALLEPIIIVFMGGGVGFIAFSILMPLIQMNDFVQ